MTDGLAFYGIMVPVAIAAGFVRGFAGFGGPLILVPSLQFFLSPKLSVAIALGLDLLANLRLLPEANGFASRRVLWPLVFGSALGLPLGLAFLQLADPDTARRTNSLVIISCSLAVLMGWRFRQAFGQESLIAVGALGGVSLAVSGISVIVNVALQAGHETLASVRANFIVWAFLVTLVAIVGFAFSGDLVSHDVLERFVFLVPAYVGGVMAGVACYSYLPHKQLKTATLVAAITLSTMGLF